jgi:hypothetical protein
MDEANQTERCSIQVATNKFHNVLTKGNSRRTDVHCYRYERERERMRAVDIAGDLVKQKLAR